MMQTLSFFYPLNKEKPLKIDIKGINSIHNLSLNRKALAILFAPKSVFLKIYTEVFVFTKLHSNFIGENVVTT